MRFVDLETTIGPESPWAQMAWAGVADVVELMSATEVDSHRLAVEGLREWRRVADHGH